MSAVLVTGGTGTLGRHAVRILRAQGHDVRVLWRRTGGDLRTGAGVREAADGVELVLHAASDPHYRSGAGDPQQTLNRKRDCGRGLAFGRARCRGAQSKGSGADAGCALAAAKKRADLKMNLNEGSLRPMPLAEMQGARASPTAPW